MAAAEEVCSYLSEELLECILEYLIGDNCTFKDLSVIPNSFSPSPTVSISPEEEVDALLTLISTFPLYIKSLNLIYPRVSGSQDFVIDDNDPLLALPDLREINLSEVIDRRSPPFRQHEKGFYGFIASKNSVFREINDILGPASIALPPCFRNTAGRIPGLSINFRKCIHQQLIGQPQRLPKISAFPVINSTSHITCKTVKSHHQIDSLRTHNKWIKRYCHCILDYGKYIVRLKYTLKHANKVS
ncbi:hypothetical protein RYX36_011462 [Vicia faba]